MKWYGIEEGNWLVELMLKWKAKSLYNFCRRHKLNYAEVYFLDTNGSATINLRAKKGSKTIADSYAFVKARSKKE